VYYAKYRCVGPNSKRESQDCHSGEAGRLAQRAETKAQILTEVLNPIYTSRVPASLFGLLGTAQVESCAATRFFLRHPLRHAFFGFSFEVIAQLRDLARFAAPFGRFVGNTSVTGLGKGLPVTRAQSRKSAISINDGEERSTGRFARQVVSDTVGCSARN
jgi:hypothetical protein